MSNSNDSSDSALTSPVSPRMYHVVFSAAEANLQWTTETARDDSAWIKSVILSTLLFGILWTRLVTLFSFFLPNELVGEQKVSAVFAECIILMGAGTTRSFIHFTFYFPLHFSIPAGDLSDFLFVSVRVCVCVCVCFIHFNFIVFFSPSFHLISPRTNTNCSHPESLPRSVVPHFVCLHFTARPGKATFRARLQSESRCCCFRRRNAADFACQGILQGATRVAGFAGLTPTPARAHTRQTSTRSALPSVLCCFIVLCHLPASVNAPICLSL